MICLSGMLFSVRANHAATLDSGGKWPAVSYFDANDFPELSTVTAVPASKGAAISFTLSATSGPVSSYSFNLYKDPAMTIPVAGSPFIAHSPSLAVTGLAPLTSYYYSAAATDGSYTSAAIIGSFSTLCITPPAPSTFATQHLCPGATVANLGATPSAGGTINWYSSLGGPPLATTASVSAGTYYVTQSVDGCESEPVTVTVTIYTIPLPVAPANQSFCFNALVIDLVVSGDTSGNIQWYSSATGLPVDNGSYLSTGDYYVTQSLFGCESEPVTVHVIINTSPVLITSQTHCTGALVSDIALPAGAMVVWTLNDAYVGGTEPLVDGIYELQSWNECLNSGETVTITLIDMPDAPEADEEQVFNTGQTVADLEVDFEAGTTATWYILDEDNYVAIPDTTLLEDGATYYVTQGSGYCQSDYTPITARLLAGSALFNSGAVSVYPNPATDVINIEAKEIIMHMALTNLLGQKVIEDTPNSTHAVLNINKLASGTYLLRVSAADGDTNMKIIKK